VGSPWKVASGANVTFPDPSTLHVPSPGTASVVCWPGVLGSRSTVVGSRLLSGSVSLLVTFTVTAPGGLFGELSLLATGGWPTVGARVSESSSSSSGVCWPLPGVLLGSKLAEAVIWA